MGSINSRQKGAAGEREFRDFIREYGYEARRGQQFSGDKSAPDVIHNIPGVHFEVKRVEKLNINEAMRQAEDDAQNNLAIVAHRRNGENWKITLRADDFFRHFLPGFVEAMNAYKKEKPQG